MFNYIIYDIPKKIRNLFSRIEWDIKLFRYPKCERKSDEPGIIMIQIDGLSKNDFEKAVNSGRMPFLENLLKKNGYKLYSLYSGLPSTTPAVQGELFFGIKTCVPSFQFKDHETGKMTSLFNPNTAYKLQKKLEEKAEKNILKDASTYSDIYTGIKEYSSFCTSSSGFSDYIKKANPLKLIWFFSIHGFIFIRIIALLVIETIIAFIDFFRGIIKGKNLFKEMLFVPNRVALVILLRELITLGVKMDAASGLPLIHCNFLGYDEQSHRRGPDSKFAMWTLKGIDRCIKNIFRSSKRSDCRDYDVWIYSDHGQEKTVSYEKLYHKNIQKSVSEVLTSLGIKITKTSLESHSIQANRSNLFGINKLNDILKKSLIGSFFSPVEIAVLGPLGHIYIPETISSDLKQKAAVELVKKAHIPIVFLKLGKNNYKAWTKNGCFRLPEFADEVFGNNNLFKNELIEDFIRILEHPDAGDFVMSGWDPNGTPITFVNENGSHAGPGTNETNAFGLFPKDIPLKQDKEKKYIRPFDLHKAVCSFLDKKQKDYSFEISKGRQKNIIRIMTYNVHSCLGRDGKDSYMRIARIIAGFKPDIVSLQELDVGKIRSGNIDQAKIIADILNMHYHFHPSFCLAEEKFGNAILSLYPMKIIKADTLSQNYNVEPRGAVMVKINCMGKNILVLNTHLGLKYKERAIHIEELLGDNWLKKINRDNTVICGDFNFSIRSRLYKKITNNYNDIFEIYPKKIFSRTWMGIRRIDYIFISYGINVKKIFVPRNHLTKIASDHYPIIADIEI
jgi:endonuclease/exonuclease/phosphatase family metal-dependent hydrolase